MRYAALGGAFGLLASAAQAQVNCIPIDTIDVTGITLLSPAETDAALAPFRGQCLDIAGINAALEAITFLYVDKGYVTARAYLPEQNIADRSLDITVVEGELSAVTFNGEDRPLWEAIVFPNLIGKSANLREIEQGLEIIRSMPAYNATMEIGAGEEEGQSVLEVTATAERPWTARIGANNQGTKGSGEYLGTLDLTYDHLLGLNESWSLSYTRGTEEFPFSSDTGGAATENIGGSVRFPYGRWALMGNYKYSSYETDTLGPITTIGTDGWTHSADIELSRVMHRNQDSKTILSGTIEYRDNVNRIAEIEINASSRTLASARLDLEHERSLWGGSMTARVGYEQGIPAFGAEEPDDTFSSSDPQFELGDFELSYFRPWQLETSQISYTGVLRGQYSDDALYGAYTLTVGGLSSVRGAKTLDFDATDAGLFAGNAGAVWRNDVAWTPQVGATKLFGSLQTYAALDAGAVRVDNSDRARPLVGSAVGLRTVGGTVSIDLGYQEVLRMPNDDAPPDGIFIASLSARF
ncbi:ShlB/FhaC/HecB family hemolysin secretion/activation protein [Yoonia sp. F2084L]|uniref:ShlB/FhaC/HecB family hemolysin secretion/activation protein n=1 Tax=Yoonia sp. F2084L TaxID=2926419 RepID=UPI001FF14FA1|nr:ShlB/FhaC/HecB family hemolysin secretion/activation protein [Yoonia sp. F2084L]MCK0097433.1 ShlB/FhaC/HecB family hemolysin secretion/activation protein [Yoonia sp. F2084L]